MTIEQLREVNEAQPFQPYKVHLADGRNLDVPHREFLAVHPRGRTAIVFRPDGSFNIIDVMLITDIQVIPLAPGGNEKRESADRN